MTPTCRVCQSVAFEQRLKGPHLGLYCVTCETFHSWIKKPLLIEQALESVLYFGQHKGKKLKDLPNDYLEYLVDSLESKIATMAQMVLDHRRLPKEKVPN